MKQRVLKVFDPHFSLEPTASFSFIHFFLKTRTFFLDPDREHGLVEQALLHGEVQHLLPAGARKLRGPCPKTQDAIALRNLKVLVHAGGLSECRSADGERTVVAKLKRYRMCFSVVPLLLEFLSNRALFPAGGEIWAKMDCLEKK